MGCQSSQLACGTYFTTSKIQSRPTGRKRGRAATRAVGKLGFKLEEFRLYRPPARTFAWIADELSSKRRGPHAHGSALGRSLVGRAFAEHVRPDQSRCGLSTHGVCPHCRRSACNAFVPDGGHADHATGPGYNASGPAAPTAATRGELDSDEPGSSRGK